MRDYILAGELYAIKGLDKKISNWAIWNKMIEDEKSDINSYGIWKSLLSPIIAEQICKIMSLSNKGIAKINPKSNIMPPKAWKINPNIRTEGKDSVLIVAMKSEAQMFGYNAPDVLPERQRIRMLATAMAYDVEYVYYAILVDGYRSDIFLLHFNNEEKEIAQKEINAMVKMVKENDEPIPDYSADKSSIRNGSAVHKLEASKDAINEMAKQRYQLSKDINNMEKSIRPKSEELSTIDTKLIYLLSDKKEVDCGEYLIKIKENKNGLKKIEITEKNNNINSLF